MHEHNISQNKFFTNLNNSRVQTDPYFETFLTNILYNSKGYNFL